MLIRLETPAVAKICSDTHPVRQHPADTMPTYRRQLSLAKPLPGAVQVYSCEYIVRIHDGLKTQLQWQTPCCQTTLTNRTCSQIFSADR